MVRDTRCYYTCVTAFDFDIRAVTDLQFFPTFCEPTGWWLIVTDPTNSAIRSLCGCIAFKLLLKYDHIFLWTCSFEQNLTLQIHTFLYFNVHPSIFIIQSNSSLNTWKHQHIKLKSNTEIKYRKRFYIS